MAIKMQVDILQLFSQWAIFTGEKGPKNYWGFFFYFHLKLWKVLTKPQLSIKEFLQNQSVKKKNVSPSLEVTLPCTIHPPKKIAQKVLKLRHKVNRNIYA